jgi:phage head maturation protease
MKNRIALATIITATLGALLAGCSDSTLVHNRDLQTELQEGRIRVKSVQVIVDSRGYRRDIMVLYDSQTGYEYIAVMGAGVTDMRMQNNGKTKSEVED